MIPFFIIIYHHKGAQRNPWHSSITQEGELEKVCKKVVFQG